MASRRALARHQAGTLGRGVKGHASEGMRCNGRHSSSPESWSTMK